MPSHLLSWICFTPLIGMVLVLAAPRRFPAVIGGLGLLASFVPLSLASLVYFAAFQDGSGDFQLVERIDWIRSIHAEYHVGIDGLSLALVWLGALLFFVAVCASISLARADKAYFAL